MLAAVLRCFYLGEQSLWIDEVLTWYSAHIGQAMGWAEIRENVHGPLHSLILHGWGAFAGDAEWALRFPSAVFGILTVPAMAWLAHRVLGPGTAVPAAWLTAASPFLVWYSQEARNYSLLILCTCVSSAVLIGLRERATAGRVAAYVAAAAAGLLSNLSFTLLAPLHAKWWLTGPGRTRLRVLAAVAIGLALLTAPWMHQATRIWDWSRLAPLPAEEVQEPLRGITTFHAGALPFAAWTFAVGYTLGPSLRELRSGSPVRALRAHAPVVAVAGIVFAMLALLGLRAAHRRGRLADLLIWLVVPALLVSYLALQNFKVFHPRYLAVAAPAFVLLLAAAFADLRPRARIAFATVVGVLWAASLWNHYLVPAYGKEDFRTAEAIVRAGASVGEQILAVHSVDAMAYYHRGDMPVRQFWLGFAASPPRLEAKLVEALSAASGSWVVLSRPEDLDPDGAFERLMDSRYPDAESFRTEGVRVWHVTARESAVQDGGE